MKEKSIVLNGDCISYLKEFKENEFNLAIVDVPYGINHSSIAGKQAGQKYGKAAAKKGFYKEKDWDNKSPDLEYFDELFRVSQNQIIWGANHFISKIPFNSSSWIVWDKDNGDNNFADCELAWTSFNTAVRKFKFTWNGMIQQNMKNKETRIHPTQKPVALYEWLLLKYAKEGDKILDTHLGSGSSRIAAYKLGFDFVGMELDKDYFDAQEQRFESQRADLDQFRNFVKETQPEVEQLKLM